MTFYGIDNFEGIGLIHYVLRFKSINEVNFNKLMNAHMCIKISQLGCGLKYCINTADIS